MDNSEINPKVPDAKGGQQVATNRMNYVQTAYSVEEADSPEVKKAGDHVRPERTAIFVCHGMGQQVPFETIDTVSRVLRKALKEEGVTQKLPDIKVDMVALGNGNHLVPRAELSFKDSETRKTHDVHVYESYWAPLTEGKVSLRDVMSFLGNAGGYGLWRSRKAFSRFMFGEMKVNLSTSRRTPLFLLIALMVAATLVLLNGVILAVAAARAFTQAKPSWPSNELLADLTIDFLILFLGLILLGIVFFFARYRQRSLQEDNDKWVPKDFWLKIWVQLSFIVVWLNVLIVLLVGALVLWQLNWHWMEGAKLSSSAEMWWSRSMPWLMERSPCLKQISEFETSGWSRIFVGAIWLVVVVASFFAKKFLVQYPGDVAAYVSAHEASKYSDIRSAISKAADGIAEQIYSLKDGNGFFYDQVVVVGHSLGSVVAYDTLNSLLLKDRVVGSTLDIAKRTPMFLTFGSPLDKVAYIFRNHRAVETDVREGLAAAVQPMISDYKFRPASWVNLYTWHDWISGHLDYFDDKSNVNHKSKWIRNIVDPYACIHVMAHVQYWTSPIFAGHLLKAVTKNPAKKLLS